MPDPYDPSSKTGALPTQGPTPAKRKGKTAATAGGPRSKGGPNENDPIKTGPKSLDGPNELDPIKTGPKGLPDP